MTFHRSLFWALMLLSLQLGSCVGISATIARAGALNGAAVDIVQ
jgi:hypothetical protein